MRDLTAVSLFSGVGGLDLGVHQAGFRHLLMCESDSYRRDVLRARFPGVPIADDVRDVAWHGDALTDERGARRERGRHGARGTVDLLCGGFPCQDLSVAGQRKGLQGGRSGLFFEYARIADLVRPRWLLTENVPGLLSSNGGRDFGVVLGTLADVGYGLAWRILDSRFFGVPQRRRRVFIVGARIDDDPRAASERAGEILAVGTRCPGHPATRGETRGDVAVASLSGLGSGGPDDNDGQGGRLIAETLRSHPRPGSNSDGNLAYTLNAKAGYRDGDADTNYVVAAPLTSGSHPNSNARGRRKEDDENLVAYGFNANRGQADDLAVTEEAAPPLHSNPVGVLNGASVRRLTPTECERLQALPDGWTDLGGTADSKRYAALGDAVTVSVAYWIAARIAAASSPTTDTAA